MRNIDVRRAFFTEEPKTLFEVREVALLKEVISDVVLVYPLGVMSPDPSSKGSRDVGTQTGTNGGYLSKSKTCITDKESERRVTRTPGLKNESQNLKSVFISIVSMRIRQSKVGIACSS